MDMNLQFNVDKTFLEGICRISGRLGFDIGEGITVTAEAADRPGVTLSDRRAVI